MRVMLQSLIPGMEHAEEADLCAKVPGIASDLQQSFSTGAKQQVVEQSLVLQCQRREFPRQCEDDVDVAGGQQLSLTRLEPAQARDTWGSAGFGTSCKRWRNVRSQNIDRDAHPARRYGSA